MEERGILLPVNHYEINFLKPAFYDDEIKIVTTVHNLPDVRFFFSYECFNIQNELINSGKVTLVFVNKVKNKPCRAPNWFLDKLNPYFTK